MSDTKRCAACRKEKPVSEMKVCMHAQMHNYVCDSKCMNDFYNPPKKTAPEAEPVAWREHSANYAKGEKCPETIETLQAAWARDQELIDDMRHEISRHKTRINRLEQRRTPQHDADLVERERANAECFRHIATDLVMKVLILTSPGDELRRASADALERIDAKLAALSAKNEGGKA